MKTGNQSHPDIETVQRPPGESSHQHPHEIYLPKKRLQADRQHSIKMQLSFNSRQH